MIPVPPLSLFTMPDRSRKLVSKYRLSTQERARIVPAPVEGDSIRVIARMTGFAKNTVTNSAGFT